ncbi:MAG: hypothetical protein DMG05_23365 [Acidobacteria bacterium]|nr:MAG: hypothetical protein DMG05_23365 [Acidobacteriota bacterium]
MLIHSGAEPISAYLRLDHLLIRGLRLGTWLQEEGNAKNAKTAKSKGFPADLLKLSACLWN